VSKFSRGAYRRPKTYKNIDLYTFLRTVRREIFLGYIGGIYRVERDFGGIYRVAVYIGSKNIDIYTAMTGETCSILPIPILVWTAVQWSRTFRGSIVYFGCF